METSPRDDLIGQHLGDFMIERLLGVGGMAYVYQAHDVLLGRHVAVKALPPAFLTDSDYVERFRREAQRIATLEHPHIAPVLQFIEQGRYLVRRRSGRTMCGRLSTHSPVMATRRER